MTTISTEAESAACSEASVMAEAALHVLGDTCMESGCAVHGLLSYGRKIPTAIQRPPSNGVPAQPCVIYGIQCKRGGSGKEDEEARGQGRQQARRGVGPASSAPGSGCRELCPSHHELRVGELSCGKCARLQGASVTCKAFPYTITQRHIKILVFLIKDAVVYMY